MDLDLKKTNTVWFHSKLTTVYVA